MTRAAASEGEPVQLIETAGLVACSFRTLPRFRLVRAGSIGEAVDALAAAERPAVLAGGTDLPARFNEGFAPSVMVDVAAVPGLRAIDIVGGMLSIGAAVTHEAGSTHPLVRQHLPGFAATWARIANVRIRMSATLGGNLMARRTRYEGAILLTALSARLRFATTDGETEIPAEDIWTAKLSSAALLTAILIPLRAGLEFDYERSLRPIMTQAVARDATGRGRVVTATEHVVPQILELDAGSPPEAKFATRAFADPVTGDAYLRRASGIFLARQLQRMGAA